MIQYFSITTFRNRIASLLKIKRGVYAGVTSEIVKEFNGKTIEQIRQNRDMILCENDVIIIIINNTTPARQATETIQKRWLQAHIYCIQDSGNSDFSRYLSEKRTITTTQHIRKQINRTARRVYGRR